MGCSGHCRRRYLTSMHTHRKNSKQFHGENNENIQFFFIMELVLFHVK